MKLPHTHIHTRHRSDPTKFKAPRRKYMSDPAALWKEKEKERKTSNKAQSHVVKHTANFLIRTTIRLVVMMHLRRAHRHGTQIRAGNRSWHSTHARTRRTRRSRWADRALLRHMSRLSRDRLSSVNLSHTADTSAAQSRVLIAVTPAVDSTLDQSTLAPQSRIQFCQCPADGIAFCFVDQSVPAILVLTATGARVHAVLGLEFLRERVHDDGFHVTPDGVFHFHPVSGIFEGDPLHAVAVLSHD